jgi:hypothetical protein
MPTCLRRAFPLLGFCAVLFAQTPSPTRPRTGAVEGDVTDSVTQKPIAGARVTPQGGLRALFTRCDANGRFQFQAVPLGEYQAAADQPGYMGFGQPPVAVRLSSGNARAQVHILLPPRGVVSGRIVDSADVPIERMTVELLELRAINAKPASPPAIMRDPEFAPRRDTLEGGELVVVAGAQTNDLGEYRFAHVAPGTYYVYAWTDEGPEDHEKTARRTYYPHALRAESARPVAVSAGQEVSNIDIQAIIQPYLWVSGHVVPPVPRSRSGSPVSTSAVAWRPKAPAEELSPGFFTDDAFELGNFLPGPYVIVAVTTDQSHTGHPLLAGRRTIEVPDKDLDGVEIPMQPPVDLKGAVVFDKTCPAVPVSIEPSFDTGIASFNQLVRSARLGPIDPQVAAAATGTFTLRSLVPATYRLAIHPRPPRTATNLRYSVASAKLGDRDVLRDGFEVTGQPPGTLRISIACGGQPGAREVAR